jgi:hypothetical protein
MTTALSVIKFLDRFYIEQLVKGFYQAQAQGILGNRPDGARVRDFGRLPGSNRDFSVAVVEVSHPLVPQICRAPMAQQCLSGNGLRFVQQADTPPKVAYGHDNLTTQLGPGTAHFLVPDEHGLLLLEVAPVNAAANQSVDSQQRIHTCFDNLTSSMGWSHRSDGQWYRAGQLIAA